MKRSEILDQMERIHGQRKYLEITQELCKLPETPARVPSSSTRDIHNKSSKPSKKTICSDNTSIRASERSEISVCFSHFNSSMFSIS